MLWIAKVVSSRSAQVLHNLLIGPEKGFWWMETFDRPLLHFLRVSRNERGVLVEKSLEHPHRQRDDYQISNGVDNKELRLTRQSFERKTAALQSNEFYIFQAVSDLRLEKCSSERSPNLFSFLQQTRRFFRKKTTTAPSLYHCVRDDFCFGTSDIAHRLMAHNRVATLILTIYRTKHTRSSIYVPKPDSQSRILMRTGNHQSIKRYLGTSSISINTSEVTDQLFVAPSCMKVTAPAHNYPHSIHAFEKSVLVQVRSE